MNAILSNSLETKIFKREAVLNTRWTRLRSMGRI